MKRHPRISFGSIRLDWYRHTLLFPDFAKKVKRTTETRSFGDRSVDEAPEQKARVTRVNANGLPYRPSVWEAKSDQHHA